MKKYSLLMAFLIVGTALAVYSFASPAVTTSPGQQQASGYSYAYLTIQANDRVTWDIGGPNEPRVRTLNATYRDLGGSQRTTIVNLLNAIGQNGWELVQTDQSVFVFKRRD